MLVVNPVNRITVAEIRQDPWFLKNLPEYLWPPAEEFHDTGVDPSKLPARHPKASSSGLHEDLVGRISKTLGYGKEDVSEALKKKEPSAIKDAYNIVKENEMMRRDCESPLRMT